MIQNKEQNDYSNIEQASNNTSIDQLIKNFKNIGEEDKDNERIIIKVNPKTNIPEGYCTIEEMR